MGARRILKVTNQGQIEFYEDSGSGTNKVAIKAAATMAADLTWILPAADSVGFLKNDGVGNLTWNAGSATLDTAYQGGNSINITGGNPVIIQANAGAEFLRIESLVSGTNSFVAKGGASTNRLGTAFNSTGVMGMTSAHDLNIQTNNANRMNISAVGDVAIGSSGATTQKLFVLQTSATDHAIVATKTGASAGRSLYAKTDATGSFGDSIVTAENTNSVASTISEGSYFECTTKGAKFQLKVKDFYQDSAGPGSPITLAGIPAGALVLGVVGRVINTAGTVTTFDVGVGGATTRYAAAVNYSVGTTWDSLASGAGTSPIIYNSATNLIATAASGSFNGSDVFRAMIYYIDLVVPTS